MKTPQLADITCVYLLPFISLNWRRKPLVSHEAIVNLIAATTTPKGIKVAGDELNVIQIEREEFHGEWNYSILPNCT